MPSTRHSPRFLAFILLGLVAVGGSLACGSDTTSARTSTVLDWRDPAQVVELGDGFSIAACEGAAPFLCVAENGEHRGTVEGLRFPAASFAFYDVSASDLDNLRSFADDFVTSIRGDRSVGCPTGYRVEPLEPRRLDRPGAEALRFGFIGTMADGSPSEVAVQIGTLDGADFVLLATVGHDAGGCPGRDDQSGFDSATLLAIEDRLVSTLATIPPPPAASTSGTSSVLGRHLGFDVDAGAELARAADLERRVGDLATACMSELGFRHVHPTSPRSTPHSTSDGPEPYSPQWIVLYGLGVTTLALPQAEVGPGLIGHHEPLQEHGAADPNAAELASLGPDEQAEYHRVLDGRPGGQVDGVAVEGEPGCLQRATEAVFANDRTAAFMAVFGDELDAIDDRVAADPRVLEFEQEVADCVTDAGFTLTPGDNPVERFSARLGELLDIAGALPVDRRPMLADLQAEELAFASALLECGGDPRSEQRFLVDIRNEYEQDFLERNADRVAVYAIGDTSADD